MKPPVARQTPEDMIQDMRQRQDARFGMTLLALGLLLQLFGALGFSRPMSEWYIAAIALVVSVAAYFVQRGRLNRSPTAELAARMLAANAEHIEAIR